MTIQRYEETARYAQMVVHGDTIYLAGQVAEDWDQDIAGQMKEIFAKIDRLLSQAGSTKSKILTMTCWIHDFADYCVFNETYDAWVDRENLPARATVKAELLDARVRIEVMLTAAR